MIGQLSAHLPPGLREDPRVAAVLAEGRARAATVFHLAYRAPAGEAGIQKTFDFSRTALAGRWEAGARDMRGALRVLAAPPDDGGLSDRTRPGGPAQVHTDSPDGRGRQEGSGAKSSAAELASEARGAVSGLQAEAAGIVQDVKADGAVVVEAAQERATGFAEEQRRAGAEQADSLARAVHRAADEMQGASPQIARYVHEAASSVDHLARALRDRSPGELIGGVEEFARRQPVAFFGAAVLAGFALARFAKSSAQDARPSAHNTGSDYGTRPTRSQSPPFGGSRAMPRKTPSG
jgi:hypothetical protein